MAERLNAPVLKTGKVATPSRVRIPVSPPHPLIFNYSKLALIALHPMLYLSSWPCAFAAMEIASAVFVIAGTLAGGARAGFRIALVHIFML